MNLYEIINIIENNKSIKELLGSCPYSLLKYWKIRHFSENETIISQGEECNSFAIITDGIAEIINISEDGKQYCQALYTKGNYLGEIEIFDKLNYCCNVVAMTKLTVIELEYKHFYELVEKDKNFIIKLTKNICKSFHTLSIKASEDTMKPVKYRICNILLGFIKDKMYVESTGQILVKKSKLSDIMAVTMRSIDRSLKELKDEEIIKVKEGYIYILDVKKLEKEII